MTASDDSSADGPEALDRLAAGALDLWDLPGGSDGAQVRLMNVSENRTYRVEGAGGIRAVLRLHRAGYHSRRAVESELAWIAALDAAGAVAVPRVIAGRDGQAVQLRSPPGAGEPRLLVLFEHVPGRAPDEGRDLPAAFERLGAIAARCHAHARSWAAPDRFERPRWDAAAVFGPDPIWGDWRRAPHVDGAVRPVLEAVEAGVRARLASYGTAPDRFGLIHADMRLANLLDGPGGLTVIDFDDCGAGWLLYDFAAAVSFLEADPRLPRLKAAWLRGYAGIRPPPPGAHDEMDTFVMLRRMALLAWVGSRPASPEPQALAPHFARVTADLGRAWLARTG